MRGKTESLRFRLPKLTDSQQSVRKSTPQLCFDLQTLIITYDIRGTDQLTPSPFQAALKTNKCRPIFEKKAQMRLTCK
jgi:hypothetical protein